ncbi:dihydropteroate synthase, partial [Enterococcus faecalis]|uniref:dihydropteroate synthase n=1 Tax=Enterococcus faecalis TaxID=1351 RepID=UPI003CC615B2
MINKIRGFITTTPDSFSDGGSYTTVDVAYQHALHQLEAGADILDIGGQSTRPGYEEVSPQVEADRVLPLIKKIRETSLA